MQDIVLIIKEKFPQRNRWESVKSSSQTMDMHYIESLCSGDNFKMIMNALKEYAKSQSDTAKNLCWQQNDLTK